MGPLRRPSPFFSRFSSAWKPRTTLTNRPRAAPGALRDGGTPPRILSRCLAYQPPGNCASIDVAHTSRGILRDASRGLGQRQRGLLAVRDGGQRGLDHTASFVELLVGDYQRNEDANHIVEGAGGGGDEAGLVAILFDFPGLGVRRLAGSRRSGPINCA